MKRTVSILLCAVLLFSLAVSAFALSIVPATDKTVVKAGENVTVTLSIDEALQAVNGMEVRVYFNSTLFEKKSYEPLDANISGLTSTVKTDEVGSYITLNYICTADSGADIAAGEFCRITFTAKSDMASMSPRPVGCPRSRKPPK